MCLGTVVFCPLQTQAAKPTVPVEDLARKPKLSQVSFSPSGNRFAAIRQDEKSGRFNIVAGDLKTHTLSQVTNFTTTDVGQYHWVGEGRLLFTVYETDKAMMEQRRAGGWYAVNTDGTEGKDLTDNKRGFGVLRTIPGQDTEILIESYDRDAESPDVARLNTRTGKRVLVSTAVRNPGRVATWVLDAKDMPRAAITSEPHSLNYSVWYRPTAESAWEKLGTYDQNGPGMKPLAFTQDGELLVETSLVTGDKTQVRVYDPKTKQVGEVLAEATGADTAATPLFDPTTRALLGLITDGDKPEFAWFDATTAKAAKTVNAALPAGSINTLRLLENGKYSVVSRSDRIPATYYLYDPVAGRIEEVLRPMDWLKPEQMAKREPFRYTARDGLEIPAYLTLPVNKPAQKLPLIAWIHGGPWARDDWGWDTNAQFFASRGYAVFQPNYRGSDGFGIKHMTSSFKQLGLTMQDDITDGIRDLIKRGIVDENRVCIGGASYGGYATMMGLIKEPGLFKCGIDVMGVTDLAWWHDIGYTDFNLLNNDATDLHLDRTIGDTKKDAALLKANSPRFHADKVKAPVLIIHGSNDRRVPIVHAEAMRSALIEAKNEPGWVVYTGEGHGFNKFENRVDYYRQMGDFLDRHIGDQAKR